MGWDGWDARGLLLYALLMRIMGIGLGSLEMESSMSGSGLRDFYSLAGLLRCCIRVMCCEKVSMGVVMMVGCYDFGFGVFFSCV